MGLKGKLSAQIEMKSGGDVYHDLLLSKPHQISEISPNHIQGCDLHEGQWRTVGSIYTWKFTHEGKENVTKDVIEAIDEEKRSVTFKVLEAPKLQLYKYLRYTFHVDTHDDIDSVTWTLEYEKLNDDVEEPLTWLDFAIKITKDVESHHLKTTT